MPAVLPVLAVAGLLGWAFCEPDDAEAIRPVRALLVLPVAIVWLRALLRVGWSIVRARRRGPAVTVGLLRPKVHLDPAFAALLDDEAQEAVLAHERAHARHHDPLRLLLAQIVTDLQWPIRGARRRFNDWTQALELARDEEARLNGADGAALAKAIVTCVKLTRGQPEASAALGGGDEHALALRVGRLLDGDVPPWGPGAGGRRRVGSVLLGIVLSFAGGALVGEEAVRLLLRVFS